MRRAAAAYEALKVRLFVDPPAGLGYPFDATPLLRPLRRYVREGDLERVRFDYDFQGLQYYGPLPLRRVPIPGLGAIPTRRAAEAEAMLTSSVGVPVEPGGLLEILRRYREHPGCRRMILTENGFGGWDRLEAGRVRDELRILYVKRHLESVLTARREGIPIDGYFYWSYADNIEWILGRDARFGLVHVDYENGYARTPKDSAFWFRDFLAGQEI
jgi:beta-glucosidase